MMNKLKTQLQMSGSVPITFCEIFRIYYCKSNTYKLTKLIIISISMQLSYCSYYTLHIFLSINLKTKFLDFFLDFTFFH
jgi:hypothetical protein